MTPENSLRPGLHPSIVLSAYVEPLVRGRRVAILGDATIGLADELSQRGARLVHVYDPDTARTAEAMARLAPGRPHQVAYAVLAGDLGVRDGAFDVVIVPDLGVFTDPADVMRRARRLCSQAGVAVFVTPNAGATGRKLLARGAPKARAAAPASGAPLGYYELYDLVSLQFAKVRMIGQAPFVGYTVADFTLRGDPEVSVDTSLLATSEEPEHFIALASDRPVSLDAYAVIELPWADVAEAAAPSEPTASARSAEKLALAEAEARVTLLSSELDKLRERAAEQAREVEARAPVATALSARVAELEAEAAARDARVKEAEARAGDNHVRAERLTSQIRDLDEELRRQRDRGTKLSKLLDDEKKARTKAEVELGMARGTPGAKERLEAIAAELAAAQSRATELEMELAETRRRPAVVAPPPADEKLTARIAELEMELAETRRRPAVAAPPPADEKLIARIAELDQALSAALCDASDAAAQRDTALDRAQRAEARVAALSAQVSAEQREKAEAAAHAAAATDQVVDLERRLLAERDRAAAAVKQAAEASRRTAEAEQQAAEAAGRAAGLARTLAEVEGRARDLEARAADHDRRVAELTEALAAARRVTDDDLGAAEAATAEIERLEAALLDRGRVIAALTRDLRESERVGRELLGELEAPRGFNGAAEPEAKGAEDLRRRLDALAHAAARAEADLQSAHWRVAQLERELSEARRESIPPARAQVELEQALAAARDEVAALRKQLAGAS